MSNTTTDNDAFVTTGLTSDYRYAFAFGMLRGEIYDIEMELKYGSNAQLAARCRKMVDRLRKIEKQLEEEAARRTAYPNPATT